MATYNFEPNRECMKEMRVTLYVIGRQVVSNVDNSLRYAVSQVPSRSLIPGQDPGAADMGNVQTIGRIPILFRNESRGILSICDSLWRGDCRRRMPSPCKAGRVQAIQRELKVWYKVCDRTR